MELCSLSQSSERICDIHDLAKYLPPTSVKGQEENDSDSYVHDKYFSENEIHVATRDRLTAFI